MTDDSEKPAHSSAWLWIVVFVAVVLALSYLVTLFTGSAGRP